MKYNRKQRNFRNLWNNFSEDEQDKPFYQTQTVKRKPKQPNKFIQQLQQQTHRFKSIYMLENGIAVFVKQPRGINS